MTIITSIFRSYNNANVVAHVHFIYGGYHTRKFCGHSTLQCISIHIVTHCISQFMSTYVYVKEGGGIKTCIWWWLYITNVQKRRKNHKWRQMSPWQGKKANKKINGEQTLGFFTFFVEHWSDWVFEKAIHVIKKKKIHESLYRKVLFYVDLAIENFFDGTIAVAQRK